MSTLLKLLIAALLCASAGNGELQSAPPPSHPSPSLSVLCTARAQSSSFRFANYYGDHMVLQRGPARANIWGYVDGCGAVTVNFNSVLISATVTPGTYNIREVSTSINVIHHSTEMLLNADVRVMWGLYIRLEI